MPESPDFEPAIVQAGDVPARKAAWDEIAFGWEAYNMIVARFKALALKIVPRKSYSRLFLSRFGGLKNC